MGDDFNFRIIDNGDGTETIDNTRITPERALTLDRYQEYVRTEIELYIAERQKRKQERERAEMERQNKLLKNPLFRLVYLCGMI